MEIKNSMLPKLDPYRTRLDPKAEAANANADRAKGGAAQTQGAPQGDRVSLSPEARLHTTAHAEASNAPDVRQEKVNDLKERVASGEYRPDSKNIAKKLLQSETDFTSALKD